MTILFKAFNRAKIKTNGIALIVRKFAPLQEIIARHIFTRNLFAEEFVLIDQNNGWTGMGGFIVCIVFILPIILGLVLFEAITLKKKNGYKTLELYSLFAMIIVWLLSIPAYLYMI